MKALLTRIVGFIVRNNTALFAYQCISHVSDKNVSPVFTASTYELSGLNGGLYTRYRFIWLDKCFREKARSEIIFQKNKPA